MKNNNNESRQSLGERLVYERVTRDLLEKNMRDGERGKHTCGKLYKASVVLFYILSAVDFVALLINSFVNLLAIDRYSKQTNAEKTAFFRSNSVIVAIMLVLVVAAFVMMLVKRRKTACILGFVNMALHGVQISQIFVGSFPDDKRLTMTLFYSAGLLMLIFLLVIFIITLRDEFARKKAFNKELNKIYRRYSAEDDGLMSNDKWNEVIAEYESDLEKQQNKKHRRSK